VSQATTMLEQYPGDITVDKTVLARCIDACTECGQTCTACADACLSEQMVAELTRCIRDNLDCSDQCHTTAQVLSRHTGYDANLTHAVVAACRQACRTCGDSCEEHAEMHAHCRTCAESCRRCERACDELLEAMKASSGSGAESPQEAAPQQ
jgi:hypothetical protein